VTTGRFLRDQRHKGLLALARAGQGEAFRRLYRELYEPVARYLAPRAATPEDAEDLVAQVFQRFLAHLDAYDPRRGSVLSWLLGMARNALVDHHRARRPALPLDDLAEVLAGEARDPLSEIVRDEQMRQVEIHLRELPAQTREMIALRFGEGLRHREIAAILGLSEDAVKQRLSRALRELRQRLRGRSARGGEVDYAV
jgi:RNA polymerase sigma-70 factor (ECF subfamily)